MKFNQHITNIYLFINNISMSLDNISMLICRNKLYDNQSILLKKTRKHITKSILSEIDNNNNNASVNLDNKLWDENKIIIIEELLEKFGVLTLTNKRGKIFIKSLADNNIINNIATITINF